MEPESASEEGVTMSKKDKREAKQEAKKQQHQHQQQHGSKAGLQFKKLSSTELVEVMARRAAGETESAIAADLKRRKRA